MDFEYYIKIRSLDSDDIIEFQFFIIDLNFDLNFIFFVN